jgi:hypothetical protein
MLFVPFAFYLRTSYSFTILLLRMTSHHHTVVTLSQSASHFRQPNHHRLVTNLLNSLCVFFNLDQQSPQPDLPTVPIFTSSQSHRDVHRYWVDRISHASQHSLQGVIALMGAAISRSIASHMEAHAVPNGCRLVHHFRKRWPCWHLTGTSSAAVFTTSRRTGLHIQALTAYPLLATPIGGNST